MKRKETLRGMVTRVKRRDYQPIYENTFRRHRRWHRFGVLVIVLLVGWLGVWGWQQWQHYHQQQLAQFPVRGVSINQDSGYLDFQQLSKHHQFVYLQATSGATYSDDDFSNNYSRSQGASMKVGVCHTFSFTSSAEQQYAHFVAIVGSETGTLPIMINVAYYGQYNGDNRTMATQGQKLKQLVTKLQDTYQQGVIIQAKETVLTQFVRPVLPHQAEWVVDGKLQHYASPVKLIEYDATGRLTQSGQSQAVGLSVFNGTRQQWTTFSHDN